MTYGSLADEDRRELQRQAREASRAAAHAGTAPDAVPVEQPDEIADDEISFVDEPPRSTRGRRKVPPIRERLVATARANPGRWLRYQPSPDHDPARPSAIAAAAREARSGFGPGFEAKIVSKILYVRYVGESS